MIEQFSVAAASTPALTFDQDVEVLIAAEVGGIGISELKLPAGGDARALSDFFNSGLRATLAVPALPTILPPSEPSSEQDDLADRLEAMCSSVRRLAAFDPVAIGVQAGLACGRSPDEVHTLLVQGLRTLARTATKLHPRPFLIALEPVAPEWAADGWAVTSLAEAAELIDETGEPNLRIVLDTWSLSAVTAEEIAQFADRIVLVQLAERDRGEAESPDESAESRRGFGEGRSDSSATVRAFYEAGYRGWYESEAPAGPEPAAATAALDRTRRNFREFYGGLADLAARTTTDPGPRSGRDLTRAAE
jgi:sugar phosphate isomerase/epimerase